MCATILLRCQLRICQCTRATRILPEFPTWKSDLSGRLIALFWVEGRFSYVLSTMERTMNLPNICSGLTGSIK